MTYPHSFSCPQPFYLGPQTFIDEIERTFQEENIPHSWLFIGPKGVGKRTLSYMLSCRLLGYKGSLVPGPENTLANSPLWSQIVQQNHPEVHVVSGSVSVDDIRALRKKLLQTTLQPGWRVIIFPGLDQLRPECTNALLKIVEEPYPKTLFFFTASSSKIPATLRSRCCVHTLSPFSPGLFWAALERAAAFQNKDLSLLRLHRDLAHDYSQGCLGRALFLLQDDHILWVQEVWRLLDTVWLEGAKTCPEDLLHTLVQHLSTFKEILLLWTTYRMQQDFTHQKKFWALDQFFHVFQEQALENIIYYTDTPFFVQQTFASLASFRPPFGRLKNIFSEA